MKRLLILILLCFLSVPALCGAAEQEVPIVQVLVTFQELDPYMPWQKIRPELRIGYGVLISGGRILTTERLVRNARLIEVRNPRSAEKKKADLLAQDIQANVAVLTLSDKTFLANQAPVVLDERNPLKKTGEIYQFDENMEIQTGSGQIMHASLSPLADGRSLFLTFNMLTELSINGDSAPVLMDGKLVGTIIGYDRRTRIATILPSIVIKRFLDDAATAPYEGFASPGFLWKPLIQPAKRNYLGLTDERSGVLVINALPGSPVMGKLLPNDVIVSFDGYPVDNLGFFQDAELGRLQFPFLANGKHKPGDTVKVDVIREKKKQVVEIPLANWDDRESLIPENIIGEKTEYLVEGGLIITELTGRYMHGRGQGWERMIGSRLAYYYHTKASDPEESGKRIVILASVLPDQINIGYQDLRDDIITHINAKPVSNMKDVFRIAREDGAIERVRIKSSAVEIVLDKEQLPDANRRLAKSYRIDSLRFEK